MRSIEFRNLRADEIEVRPQGKAGNGKMRMLLYIDSRAVTDLLDETVGNLNWKNRFYEANGLLFNELSIRHPETGEWISRSETGTESNIEAQKGLVSDTFKRCLSRFGANQLYSSPTILIEDDGYGCTGYSVKNIEYFGKRIVLLSIVDKFGRLAFEWSAKNCNDYKKEDVKETCVEDNAERLKKFCRAELDTNVRMLDHKWLEKTLKEFHDYYANERLPKWKGDFKPDPLWESWLAKRKDKMVYAA